MQIHINCYDDDGSNYYIIDNVHIINVWKLRYVKEGDKPSESEFSPGLIYVLNGNQKVGTKYIMMDGFYTNGDHFILCCNTTLVITNDDGKKIQRITANMPHELSGYDVDVL